MTDPLTIGLALLGIALLLVVVEVFVPSAGVISVVAGAVAIAGVVQLFRVSIGWGLAGILMMLTTGPMVFFFAMNILPNTPMGRRMLFGEAGAEQPVLPPVVADRDRDLLGLEAVAVTDLRPSGTILVRGEKREASSEVSLIRAGTRVRVTHVDGPTIRVRVATGGVGGSGAGGVGGNGTGGGNGDGAGAGGAA